METQATPARRAGNGALNRLASYLTGRPIPDLTSGFRGARASGLREFLHLLPNGFSTPTTTTLAFLKAGYSVAFEPIHARTRSGQSKIRLARDGAKFLMIIFKIVTLFSPLKIFVPISLAVIRARLRLRPLERRRAVARIPNGSSPADPVRRRRFSGRARLGTDLRAAVRRTPVTRTDPARVPVAHHWSSRCGWCSGWSTGPDQPLTHDEREIPSRSGRAPLRDDGFTYPADEPAPGTGQRFGRAPGYPLFLAALHVTDPVEHAPRVMTVPDRTGVHRDDRDLAHCDAIAGRAGGSSGGAHRRRRGSRRLYPPLVAMPAYVFSETLFSTLALAAARALQGLEVGDRRSGEPELQAFSRTGARLLVSGALRRTAAAIVLTRPSMSAVRSTRRPLARSGAPDSRAAVMFAAIVVVCVLPWTIRNHARLRPMDR